MYSISISDLSLFLNKKEILKSINLKIEPSESLAIIGESGSGKSSLIRVILSLIMPTSGNISINGIDIQENIEYASDFGVLFQNSALFDGLRVWENIAFSFKKRLNINKKLAKLLCIQKLNEVGLDSSVMNLYPDELSGGMKKRVALARAIFNNPKIIILDEPTSGLDPIMSDLINDLIIAYHNKVKSTIITITHDIRSAIKIANNIAVLYKGTIIYKNKVKNIFKSHNNYVQALIYHSIIK